MQFNRIICYDLSNPCYYVFLCSDWWWCYCWHTIQCCNQLYQPATICPQQLPVSCWRTRYWGSQRGEIQVGHRKWTLFYPNCCDVTWKQAGKNTITVKTHYNINIRKALLWCDFVTDCIWPILPLRTLQTHASYHI